MFSSLGPVYPPDRVFHEGATAVFGDIAWSRADRIRTCDLCVPNAAL